MPTLNRPDLHQPILDLIGKIHGIHQAGSGQLSLEELADAFGAELSPEDREAVKQRGDVVFTKVDGAGGNFVNEGPEVERKKGNIKVTVPAMIKGTYTASALTFKLTFNQDHTVRGEIKILFVIKVKVKSIMANQQKVFVDSTIDQADFTIIHG